MLAVVFSKQNKYLFSMFTTDKLVIFGKLIKVLTDVPRMPQKFGLSSTYDLMQQDNVKKMEDGPNILAFSEYLNFNRKYTRIKIFRISVLKEG